MGGEVGVDGVAGDEGVEPRDLALTVRAGFAGAEQARASALLRLALS